MNSIARMPTNAPIKLFSETANRKKRLLKVEAALLLVLPHFDPVLVESQVY
jgi:hypothetical protein